MRSGCDSNLPHVIIAALALAASAFSPAGTAAILLLAGGLGAVPDAFALCILAASVAAMLAWRIGPIRLMIAGSILGFERAALPSSATACLNRRLPNPASVRYLA